MKSTLPLTALLLTPLAVQSDLRAFIRATVRDRPLREDVFQEVAMMLWRKFYRLDASRSFGAWARGRAARKIMEDRRESARLGAPSHPVPAPRPGPTRPGPPSKAIFWQSVLFLTIFLSGLS